MIRDWSECVFYVCVAAVIIVLAMVWAQSDLEDKRLLNECVATGVAPLDVCKDLYGDDDD